MSDDQPDYIPPPPRTAGHIVGRYVPAGPGEPEASQTRDAACRAACAGMADPVAEVAGLRADRDQYRSEVAETRIALAGTGDRQRDAAALLAASLLADPDVCRCCGESIPADRGGPTGDPVRHADGCPMGLLLLRAGLMGERDAAAAAVDVLREDVQHLRDQIDRLNATRDAPADADGFWPMAVAPPVGLLLDLRLSVAPGGVVRGRRTAVGWYSAGGFDNVRCFSGWRPTRTLLTGEAGDAVAALDRVLGVADAT